jgi:hypothetical protein
VELSQLLQIRNSRDSPKPLFVLAIDSELDPPILERESIRLLFSCRLDLFKLDAIATQVKAIGYDENNRSCTR